MFENPRRGRQARNFTTNAPKILDLKSSSEQIFSRKLPLGAPVEHEVQRLSKTFYRDARQPEVDFSQSWVCGYAQTCGQFVSISVKTLSNTNLVASRRTEREGVTSV